MCKQIFIMKLNEFHAIIFLPFIFFFCENKEYSLTFYFYIGHINEQNLLIDFIMTCIYLGKITLFSLFLFIIKFILFNCLNQLFELRAVNKLASRSIVFYRVLLKVIQLEKKKKLYAYFLLNLSKILVRTIRSWSNICLR